MASDSAAAALGKAIESGDFGASSELVLQYREALARELENASSTEERTAIVRQAISFLSDRLSLACVLRAHLCTRLNAACRAHSYTAEENAAGMFQLEG